MVQKDKEKASLFAEYFCSVFTHEKEEKFKELKLSCHIDNMPSIEITEDNVLRKLNAITTDKSPGPYQLHSRVLFEVRNEIVAPFTRVLKFSVETATLSYDWKSDDIQ